MAWGLHQNHVLAWVYLLALSQTTESGRNPQSFMPHEGNAEAAVLSRDGHSAVLLYHWGQAPSGEDSVFCDDKTNSTMQRAVLLYKEVSKSQSTVQTVQGRIPAASRTERVLPDTHKGEGQRNTILVSGPRFACLRHTTYSERDSQAPRT